MRKRNPIAKAVKLIKPQVKPDKRNGEQERCYKLDIQYGIYAYDDRERRFKCE